MNPLPTATLTFEPPGPGRWDRDISHTTAAPTRTYRRLASTTMPAAYREVFTEMGAPAATLDVVFVHGAMYRRIVPLVGAESHRPPPPKPLMWLALRLHPLFRRRNRAALSVWSDRPDRDVIERWYRSERDEWIAANRALQAVLPQSLSDEDLAAHIRELDAHVLAGWTRHHVLHGSDIGPIGDLLVQARRWGMEPTEVLPVLHGSSPATTGSTTHARRIAEALRAAGIDPGSIRDLDQVRAVPEAAELLETYLAHTGWHVVTSYDLEALTIGEMPAATCALIRAAAGPDGSDEATRRADEAIAALARRVPDHDRSEFDELVGHARRAYGMRDDNGPLLAEWSMGLLRRGFLEAGRRLESSGRLIATRHVFELDSDEVAAALDGAVTPTADDAVERAALRALEARSDPPAILGPEHGDPDLSVFPAGIRRTMDVIVTALSLLEVDPATSRDTLSGTGIGHQVYRGIARVADDVDVLIDQMEPGDVLVAPWTTPTFNALFAIAGAVVVREGGPLCHAAVMARELDIPTVIGCQGAMTEIRSGDLVEVDPLAGEVRVVTPAPDDRATVSA